jgi:hypothetical protein
MMYGSEITGMFKTSSAACRKENEYLLTKTLNVKQNNVNFDLRA